MTNFQVLLVEDNPLDARLIQAFFQKMDLGALIGAPTLAKALERLQGGDIDLVLLDLCLPDSDDLRTLLEVHKVAPDLPIIVLTGTDDGETALGAMQAGAQDYLVKGLIDAKLLERSIRYAIERKRAEGNILSYQEQLQNLASELSLTAQRERKQMATLLHDNIGQLLAIARLKLGLLQTQVPPEAVGTVKELQTSLDEAISFTRTLIGELSPPLLQELGLEAALEWLSEQFSIRHGLRVELQGIGRRPIRDEDLEGLLFWTVRELLLNTIKHAHASKVLLSLEARGNELSIRVEDDGVGFEVPSVRSRVDGGFGLFSIHERLNRIGGSLQLASAPGKGTQVTLKVPLT